MLTPETIRQDYYGPRWTNQGHGEPYAWRWHQRGWSYPRRTYWLFYFPDRRAFALRVTEMKSRRAPIEEIEGPIPTSDIDVFRALLSPEDLARCTAASITLTRSNINA